MASTPVITTGWVLTASCRKSCMRPAGTSTSRSMVCPLPFHIHHCAAAGKLRRAQLRLHRLQIGVAGRSIDDGRELRVQGHGMVRGIERKIWHIRGSLYLDPVEPAGEVTHGMQHAPNSLDGVQVSMLEGVLAGDGRVARGLRIPGAKGAHGVNIALWARRWSGSRHRAREIRAHVVQHNVLQIENLWILVRLVGANHQLRIVEHDLIHDES